MDEKTEVLLEKEFSGKLNNQSEASKAGEISFATGENFLDDDWEEPRQSNIETRVYDRDVRFYEYCETVTSALPGSRDTRGSKRAFLTVGLLVLGGLSLFSAAAAAIYNFSGKMFPPPAAVRQEDVNEPSQNESGDRSYDESRDNAFDPAKALKSTVSEDKNLSDDKKSPETSVKKENMTVTETRPERVAEQNNKIPPAANQNLNESPKTVSENTITNPVVRNVSKESETPIRSNDPKRTFPANPAQNENYQSPSFPRAPSWRQLEREEKREARQALKQNRREIFVEKVKQMPPERRNKIRNILQRRRN